MWCGIRWCGVWSHVRVVVRRIAGGWLMYPSKFIRTCVLDSVSNNVT